MRRSKATRSKPRFHIPNPGAEFIFQTTLGTKVTTKQYLKTTRRKLRNPQMIHKHMRGRPNHGFPTVSNGIARQNLSAYRTDHGRGRAFCFTQIPSQCMKGQPMEGK
jgi:hypothetical protein